MGGDPSGNLWPPVDSPILQHKKPDYLTRIIQANYAWREFGYVLRLHLPDEPGNLAEVAQALGEAGMNIDYAYTLTSAVPGEAAFVLAVVDPNFAEDLLD